MVIDLLLLMIYAKTPRKLTQLSVCKYVVCAWGCYNNPKRRNITDPLVPRCIERVFFWGGECPLLAVCCW